MKEYNMDQFFQEKLANRKETPSEDAWLRLAAELEKGKKKRTMVYWYIAASISLLLGMGYVFITENSNLTDQPSITQTEEHNAIPENEPSGSMALAEKEKSEKSEMDNKEEEKIEMNDVVESQKDMKPIEKVNKEQVQPQQQKINADEKDEVKVKTIEPVEVINIDDLVAEDLKDLGVEESQPIIPDEINEEHLASTMSTEEYPEIVITYKKSTVNDKPEKTFKKIVKLARDFSEGGYGIGQLREAKNDLLAFERKNNKNN